MLRSHYRPAVSDRTRKALAQRSQGVCEARLERCLYHATDPHHRITVKAGGRHRQARIEHDRLSNVLHLCRHCHDWATSRADQEAYDIGLCLREYQKPALEPVMYRGQLCLLTNDGRVLNCEELAT